MYIITEYQLIQLKNSGICPDIIREIEGQPLSENLREKIREIEGQLCLEISDKKYEFFWINGSSFQSSGRTPEEAFSKAGYGAGAVRVLDYYKEL